MFDFHGFNEARRDKRRQEIREELETKIKEENLDDYDIKNLIIYKQLDLEALAEQNRQLRISGRENEKVLHSLIIVLMLLLATASYFAYINRSKFERCEELNKTIPNIIP
jgi:hypothetical protein